MVLAITNNFLEDRCIKYKSAVMTDDEGDLGCSCDGLRLFQRVLPADPAAVVLLVVVVVPHGALLREQLVLGQLELDRLGVLLAVS